MVGVLPASFDFASVFAPGSHFDLVLPLPVEPGDEPVGQHDGDDRPVEAGRLRRSQAQVGDAARSARRSSREHPERNTFKGNVAPLAEHVNGRMPAWRCGCWPARSAWSC